MFPKTEEKISSTLISPKSNPHVPPKPDALPSALPN